jgi:hypothetical protein
VGEKKEKIDVEIMFCFDKAPSISPGGGEKGEAENSSKNPL